MEVIYVQHDDGPGSGFSTDDEAFEIADQVAKEIDAGILLVAMGEDESEISFERHSLHHGEIAV